MGCLGVKPIDVYRAIVKAHPAVEPYVCTGDHSPYLQTTDSEIMIEVLETLAKAGVVGLSVYASVIVPSEHNGLAERTMIDCYRRRTGFEIPVK